MDTREFKTLLYKELAQVTKALSNASRLEILDLLAQGSFPVEYIANHVNLPIANASQHLQVLKKSGLVDTYRDGKYIYYQLHDRQVLETWRSLRQLGFSRNREIGELLEDYRHRRNQMDLMNSNELLQKLENDEVYLIDVRPEDEYRLGHIKNADSIPYTYLKEKISTIPKDKEIIAYCRGPLCLMADEAVTFLRKKGFKASRLENGYADWIAESKPTETMIN